MTSTEEANATKTQIKVHSLNTPDADGKARQKGKGVKTGQECYFEFCFFY